MDDIQIAKRFINKCKDSQKRGLDFNLNFTSFKNLMRSEKCYYTGVSLITPEVVIPGKTHKLRPNDRTIDRIDASKGYIKGNVVACSFSANRFKAMFESGTNSLTNKQAIKILTSMNK